MSSAHTQACPEETVVHFETWATGDISLLDLMVRRIRLRARRRTAWLTALAANTNAGQHDQPALPPELAAILDDRDTPVAETDWFETNAAIAPCNAQLDQVEAALGGEAGARLHELAKLFQLDPPELDLLQACLALAVDPTLAPAYAHLQQHPGRTYATEALAARLFGHVPGGLWSPAGPLALWGLIAAGDAAAGEPEPLSVDPLIIAWLQDELRMDPALIGRTRIIEPREPFAAWPVEETARAIQHAAEREWAARVLIAGPPMSGRRTFAATVAARFGMRTLAVDNSDIADPDWPDSHMRAQRLALLGGMALVWHGDRLNRSWPAAIAPPPIQFFACDTNQIIPTNAQTIDQHIALPAPTLDERRALWLAILPESATWPTPEFDTLVLRYRLNPGDIVTVAQRGPTGPQQVVAFAREVTRQRLGDLGHLLDCPFTWDDLIVPGRLSEALEDFAFEARDRAAFWEQPGARRLFPRGTGLVTLFNGPPGTGKTMAAQVIAAELELDLFRIDLATVVSKYIGETAKHLSLIFSRAARMNAVLLFDEAEALFSKRTEVKDSHDRYANADTSYLLQLLEEYRGIVVLASNRKQNIDPAFLRRVRYVFQFPRPDAAERERIWWRVIAELKGEETLAGLNGSTKALAQNVELSGAQIKNAVLAGIFVARRGREALAMRHLLRGVERELGKEGRSLGAGERERLGRDG